ncbi:MAG: DUF4421 domain-containing protein [Bacteroidaceae bacterium]|nr:DUF4421 domain-containing protein [Candidatus Minthousia equi]MCQ2247234.1 DUF4421 domain-containing protein [Bacteroidaceae bacterium]
MKRILLVLLLISYFCPNKAQDLAESIPDSAEIAVSDSIKPKKKNPLGILGNIIEEFNASDTTYITPNMYNYALMIQNTSTFENFIIAGKDIDGKKRELHLAPRPTPRIGGYFGWRWIFLGYTFDISPLLSGKKNHTNKTEFNLSLYTSLVGIDVYFRSTGDDFKIMNVNDFKDSPNEQIDNNFSGLDVHSKGVNLYYLFNHRHFSYPAAYAQSTVQRKSCGSFKLGFSYSYHRINFASSTLPQPILNKISDDMRFDRVKYSDYAISFGYTYNWVAARNFLINISLSPALNYIHSHIKLEDGQSDVTPWDNIKRFNFHNLNFDFVGRLGMVYNNNKYFAGVSVVAHSFNYNKDKFSLNQSFGSVNVYVGFNFKKRKEFLNY